MRGTNAGDSTPKNTPSNSGKRLNGMNAVRVRKLPRPNLLALKKR